MSVPQDTPKAYLSCAETAKLVRKAVKADFPGIKFSVRSDTYAGGASIHVSWTDGPTESAVKGTVSLYEGATFDGMIDLKSYHSSLLVSETGEMREVHFGADFIFTRRELSQQWVDVIARRISRLSGKPCDLSRPVYDKKGHGTGAWGSGWNDRFPVCVHDGQLVKYAGEEYGQDLVHRYAQSRARVPVWGQS